MRLANPAPAELLRSLPPVTPHAPNVALCDLLGRRFPTPVPDQSCYVVDLELAITMIEVEKDGISLSAVDAGMRH